MREILKAIKLVKEYNMKSLEEIIKEIEEYTGEKIPENYIGEWKFTGLNNIDFIKYRAVVEKV